MESTLVIKVNYGDSLVRFTAPVYQGQLDLNMVKLRGKINSYFPSLIDADLALTYVDEDGDVVALVNDEDLLDVMNQNLKFLRINVQQKTKEPDARVHNPVLPLGETLSKLSTELASKAASSNPVLAGLGDSLSKLSMELASKAASSNPVLAGLGDSLSKLSIELASKAASSNPLLTEFLDGLVKICGQDSTTASVSAAATATDALPKSTVVIPPTAPVDLNVEPGYSESSYLPPSQFLNGSEKKDAKQNHHTKGKSALATFWDGPVNKCPFTDLPITDGSKVNPTSVLPRVNPFKRSYMRKQHMQAAGLVHNGVQCDGCGVVPIAGYRFKSNVKRNYDLCSVCFSEMGNETDYIKIDLPVMLQHKKPHKGLLDVPVALRQQKGLSFHSPKNNWCNTWSPNSTVRPNKFDSRFSLDVNVFDGTLMAPSTPFTKIWRMRNNGSVVWPRGTQLVWVGGDKMCESAALEIEISAEGVPLNEELDIAVDFTAPALPGRYISYWRMASPSGFKFGQRVWVLIQVALELSGQAFTSSEENICNSFQGLNLNIPMPPENSFPPHASKSRDLKSPFITPITPNSLKIDLNQNPQEKPAGKISNIFSSDTCMDPLRPNYSPVEVLAPVTPNGETSDQPDHDWLTKLEELEGKKSNPSYQPDLNWMTELEEEVRPLRQEYKSSIFDIKSQGKIAPSSSSVSYPIIDLSKVLPVEIFTPVMGTGSSSSGGFKINADKEVMDTGSSSSGGLKIDADKETILLNELKEMGFMEIEENKEILKKNDYDLEKSVDALCNVSDWDDGLSETPQNVSEWDVMILEELHEMGFGDDEVNTKLLKKNNGSIKRVVMDLLAGKKA